MSANYQPTILVILGVTGDLAARKIIPALFSLHSKQALPEHFRIIGFGRKPLTSEMFTQLISTAVLNKLPNTSPEALAEFCSHMEYVQGDFYSLNSYNQLALHMHRIEHEWNRLSHFLFYLSVPSDIYEPIINNIHSSALYRTDPEVQTRILVEKPIGKNSATADYLEQLLTSSFKEQEIYRIDHYLAKEMVQNILAFRFSNDMFEKTWNNSAIEKIEIRLWETLGVETRGNFYDGMGALRDMGQNHVLQILSLLTMHTPTDFSAINLHAKRSEILAKLQPLTLEEIPQHTYRAQYAGYQNIEGVTPSSKTETYFKIRSFIADPRWENVPIIIESGKRMHETLKEVVVTYRHSEPCWCPDKNKHFQNRIRFALEPAEGITIEFWSKKPGLDATFEKRSIDFMLRSLEDRPQYIEAYEKLLLDAVLGDQTLFVSAAEVKAMWRFIDPVIEAWEQDIVPLETYQPDTDEPVAHSLKINTPDTLL